MCRFFELLGASLDDVAALCFKARSRQACVISMILFGYSSESVKEISKFGGELREGVTLASPLRCGVSWLHDGGGYGCLEGC